MGLYHDPNKKKTTDSKIVPDPDPPQYSAEWRDWNPCLCTSSMVLLPLSYSLLQYCVLYSVHTYPKNVIGTLAHIIRLLKLGAFINLLI